MVAPDGHAGSGGDGRRGNGRGVSSRALHQSTAVRIPDSEVMVVPDCPDVILRSAGVVEVDHAALKRPRKRVRKAKEELKRSKLTSSLREIVPCNCQKKCFQVDWNFSIHLQLVLK